MTFAEYMAAFRRRFMDHEDREKDKRDEREALRARIEQSNADYIERIVPRW